MEHRVTILGGWDVHLGPGSLRSSELRLKLASLLTSHSCLILCGCQLHAGLAQLGSLFQHNSTENLIMVTAQSIAFVVSQLSNGRLRDIVIASSSVFLFLLFEFEDV